jgi:hypothetical protein
MKECLLSFFNSAVPLGSQVASFFWWASSFLGGEDLSSGMQTYPLRVNSPL